MHTIRRLNPGEAGLYRTLRLEALRDSPDAFATTHEAALQRDKSSWIQQADGSSLGDDRATFVVLADRPVGLAAIYRDSDDSAVGDLIQMWIAPSHRGGSAASDLLYHLFEWALPRGFESIRAEVTPGNHRASRFYEKYGFRRVNSTQGTEQWIKKVRREV